MTTYLHNTHISFDLCRLSQPTHTTTHTHSKMVSRRKILSRSRDDLNLDQTFTQQEEEEDVWYQKDKLYKVSKIEICFYMQFISIMRLRWQFAISWDYRASDDRRPQRTQEVETETRQMEAKWHHHDQNCRHRQRHTARDSFDFRLASCCCSYVAVVVVVVLLLWFVAAAYSRHVQRPHWGHHQHMKRTKPLATGAAAAATTVAS